MEYKNTDFVSQLKGIASLVQANMALPPREIATIQLEYEFYRTVSMPGDPIYTHENMIYGAIMYRLIEYIVEEGRFNEFLEAFFTRKDMFGDVKDKPSYRAMIDVMKELRKSMVLSSEGDVSQSLVSWANIVKGHTSIIVTLADFLRDLAVHVLNTVIFEDKSLKWGIKPERPEAYLKHKRISRETLLQDPKVDLGPGESAAIPQEIDAAMGYTLNYLLRSCVIIGRSTYQPDDVAPDEKTSQAATKVDTIFCKFNQFSVADTKENSFFRAPGRCFCLLYTPKAWNILYRSNPNKQQILLVSEMRLPLLCTICNKEITEFRPEGEHRLFISSECKYKHKFHFLCIRDALEKKCGKNIKKLILGLEDYKQIQPNCNGCGSCLCLNDLKTLFADYFAKEYIKSLEEEYKDIFKLNDACDFQGVNKKVKRSDVKTHLMMHTPFRRRGQKGATKLKMVKCDLCKNNDPHSIDLKKVVELFGSTSNIAFTRYCAQCGQITGEDQSIMRLSCRHICCDKCATAWMLFTDKNTEIFKDYVKEKIDSVTWPACPCFHCGTTKDLVSIQLHDNHYISLQRYLRKCFLNKEHLVTCVEKDCCAKVDNNRVLLALSAYIEINQVTKGVNRITLLRSEKIVPPPKITDQMKAWLRQRYAIIEEDKNDKYLIGYKNLFEAAKKELTTDFAATETLLKKFEDSFPSFMKEIDKPSIDLSLIKDAEFRERRSLADLTRRCFLDTQIFGHLYRYSLESDLLFMSLEGLADPTNFGNDLDSLCSVSGAFGRGFYLSKNPAAIHSLTRSKNDKFYMAVVCAAQPNGRGMRNVYAGDCRRVSAEETEEEREGMNGKVCGDQLVVKQDGMEWLVVFDPAMIVPVSVISYVIDLSKF